MNLLRRVEVETLPQACKDAEMWSRPATCGGDSSVDSRSTRLGASRVAARESKDEAIVGQPELGETSVVHLVGKLQNLNGVVVR